MVPLDTPVELANKLLWDARNLGEDVDFEIAFSELHIGTDQERFAKLNLPDNAEHPLKNVVKRCKRESFPRPDNSNPYAFNLYAFFTFHWHILILLSLSSRHQTLGNIQSLLGCPVWRCRRAFSSLCGVILLPNKEYCRGNHHCNTRSCLESRF